MNLIALSHFTNYNSCNNTTSSCVQSFVVVQKKDTLLIRPSSDWIGQVDLSTKLKVDLLDPCLNTPEARARVVNQ